MIGKVIWLGLVWLLYPYAMVPYIYESIHPIKLQVIHLLKKDMSEPGTRDCSNAWWYLGDEYGGSPPKRLTIDTQAIIDGTNRSRWWKNRCRLSHPLPPPPHPHLRIPHPPGLLHLWETGFRVIYDRRHRRAGSLILETTDSTTLQWQGSQSENVATEFAVEVEPGCRCTTFTKEGWWRRWIRKAASVSPSPRSVGAINGLLGLMVKSIWGEPPYSSPKFYHANELTQVPDSLVSSFSLWMTWSLMEWNSHTNKGPLQTDVVTILSLTISSFLS